MIKTASMKGCLAPARGIVPFTITAMCIGYAIVVFSQRMLNDGDTYWHIASGMWMLEHQAIPQVDPFSYTRAGAPWVAHEWLSEVLMALAYRAGGWSGIFVLFGAAAAITCGVLGRYLARWLDQPAAAATFIFGVACVGGSLLARPHLLALTALTIWTVGLIAAKDEDAAPPLFLLPLMTVWANLHASFIFGLGLALPIAFEAFIESGERRTLMVRRWGIFIVAALGASLITPHGLRGLLFPLQLIRMESNSSIAEWAPTSFSKFQPLEGALMALLYVAFTRSVRLPIGRLMIVLGLLYLAFAHTRHQMLAGVVGAIVLAKPLAQAFASDSKEATPGNYAIAAETDRRWLLCGVACIAFLTMLRLTHPVERTDGPVSPISALDHVPAQTLKEPVLNSYEFGGYLIFKHVKPYIDGRADLYGDDFISAYRAALAPDRAAFARMIGKYGIRWALLATGTPAIDMISALPQWRRVYADTVAVVYVRDGSPMDQNEADR